MRHNICRGMQAHSHLRVLAVGSAIGLACLPLAASAAPPSCKGITKGSLDVELPAGQRSSRMVRLAQGETVNFSVHSGASGATVTLVSGDGSPQALLTAGASGTARFEAPETATYVFAIEAGRDNLTSVSAICSKASGQNDIALPSTTDVTVAQIETDVEGLSRRSAFSLGLSEFAASARAAEAPVNRWADAETATPALDTAGSQDDAVSATVLAIAANAEVGPDDLDTVIARMDRIAVASADGETQTAMAWSAILAPELSFDAAPAKVADARRPARKDARDDSFKPQQVASASPVEDWWVTHLEDDRGSEPVVTETAVLRRDSVAGTSFPPPMALGAFVPTDGIAAAVGTKAAQP